MITQEKLEEIQEGYARMMTSPKESSASRQLSRNLVEIIQELIDWRKNYAMVAGDHAPLPKWVKP